MEGEGYREIVESLFGDGLLRLDAEAEHELRHAEYAMEIPQSGERIRGRDNMRAMQRSFPNPPTGVLRRVVGSGDVWVVELTSDYGEDGIWHVADIIEFRDGKIVRETRYYGRPFPAPEWRSHWVEKM